MRALRGRCAVGRLGDAREGGWWGGRKRLQIRRTGKKTTFKQKG